MVCWFLKKMLLLVWKWSSQLLLFMWKGFVDLKKLLLLLMWKWLSPLLLFMWKGLLRGLQL